MRTLLLIATIVSAPVSAQLSRSAAMGSTHAPAVPTGGYGTYVEQPRVAPARAVGAGSLDALIDDGRETGQLTRREARALRREARGVDALEERYAVGGLSDAEQRELGVRRLALHDRIEARRLGVGR